MKRAALMVSMVLLAHPAFAAVTYGPILGRGPTPDKMIVHWGSDSATSNASVSFRLTGGTAQTVTANRGCVADSGAKCDYEVTLSGLTLGSEYEYAVGGASIDGTQHFTTCPQAGAPLDVVFYGDSRSGGSEHAKVVQAVLAKGADIVFESGDIRVDGVYDGYLDASTSEFFSAAKSLVPIIPFMAVPGNHDDTSGETAMASNFGRLFPNPAYPLPAGNKNATGWQAYYSLTCGNAMFVGLDSNIATDATQTAWLKSQLADAKADATLNHVFVWFHHSPFSVGTHGDDLDTQAWAPLFEDPSNKVTAVFTGHDHDYQRITHGTTKTVTYVVSGGAGADLYPVSGSTKGTVAFKSESYNFVKLHIAGTLVTGNAYSDSGTALESHDFMLMGSGSGATTPDLGAVVDMGQSGTSGGTSGSTTGGTSGSTTGGTSGSTTGGTSGGASMDGSTDGMTTGGSTTSGTRQSTGSGGCDLGSSGTSIPPLFVIALFALIAPLWRRAKLPRRRS